MLFFGTPHRGASGAPDLAAFLGGVFDRVLRVSGAGLFKGRVNVELLEGLKANAAGLSRISEAFSHLCKPPLSVLTVYETEEQPPLGQLVRKLFLDCRADPLLGKYRGADGFCRLDCPEIFRCDGFIWRKANPRECMS